MLNFVKMPVIMIQSFPSRASIVRARHYVLATLLICLANGCAPGGTSMTIAVRDQETGAPVADAHVDLRPLHAFNPAPPHKTVDFFPTSGDSGTTDERGLVELSGVVNHPMEVLVMARGYMPFKSSVVIDPRESDPPWRDPAVEDDTTAALQRMQIQVRP